MSLIDRNIEWPVTFSDTSDPEHRMSFDNPKELGMYVEFWARHSNTGEEGTLFISDAKGRNLIGMIDKLHVYVLVVEHNTKQNVSDWQSSSE